MGCDRQWLGSYWKQPYCPDCALELPDHDCGRLDGQACKYCVAWFAQNEKPAREELKTNLSFSDLL